MLHCLNREVSWMSRLPSIPIQGSAEIGSKRENSHSPGVLKSSVDRLLRAIEKLSRSKFKVKLHFFSPNGHQEMGTWIHLPKSYWSVFSPGTTFHLQVFLTAHSSIREQREESRSRSCGGFQGRSWGNCWSSEKIARKPKGCHDGECRQHAQRWLSAFLWISASDINWLIKMLSAATGNI